MSAVPERLLDNVSEKTFERAAEPQTLQWADIPDELILSRILVAARSDLVVVAGEGAQFDTSIHSLFTSSLVETSKLVGVATESEASLINSKSVSLVQNQYPVVVLDTASVNKTDLERILASLHESIPVVLLHPDKQLPQSSTLANTVIYCLENNHRAIESWADFQLSRAQNQKKLIVLDFLSSESVTHVQKFLSLRNFQVVTVSERATTTFVKSPDGIQLLLIECGDSSEEVAQYIKRIRLSHESDVLGIVVTGKLQAAEQRCALLAVGADLLLSNSLSDNELLLSLQTLSERQTQIQQIRSDAYRFPGSVAYNTEYMMNVGSKLYASAQRDVITLALGVMRVVILETDQQSTVSLREKKEIVQKVAAYCGKNLRETDLFAQAGERDFYALVTCVGRNNIARIFSRLSEDVAVLVDQASEGRIKVRLLMGVTCELGVSFKSMIDRAQQALLTAERKSDQLVVN